jgi:hypothetical protein
MDIEYLKQYHSNTNLQFRIKHLQIDKENTTPQVIQWKMGEPEQKPKVEKPPKLKVGRPAKPKVEKIPKPKVEVVPKPKVGRPPKPKVERPRKPIEPQIIIDRNINRTIIF